MNTLIKFVVITLAMFALGNTFAQTVLAPASTAESTSADLPKELKGKWYAWIGGRRVANGVSITLADAQNLNDVKGLVMFEDKEGCPALSTPTPIEKLTIVGGLLTLETPAPPSCIDGPTAVGTKLFMMLRLERDGARWSANGEGTVKSPARRFRIFEVQTTSP